VIDVTTNPIRAIASTKKRIPPTGQAITSVTSEVAPDQTLVAISDIKPAAAPLTNPTNPSNPTTNNVKIFFIIILI
jgi:hypothetical protein